MESANPLATVPVVELPRAVTLGNLVVASDFSAFSDAALDYALSIARRSQSTIHVLRVVRSDAYQLVPAESLVSRQKMVRGWAEQEMASLLIPGRLRGTAHQVLTGEGELWRAVASNVETNEIDLVVLGTHGRAGATKLLLGSAAEQVFRLSDRAVLTVGPRVRPEHGRAIDLRQILFPTNLTAWAARALPYAVSLAEEYHARLTLLPVVKNPDDISRKGIVVPRKSFSKELEAQRLLAEADQAQRLEGLSPNFRPETKRLSSVFSIRVLRSLFSGFCGCRKAA